MPDRTIVRFLKGEKGERGLKGADGVPGAAGAVGAPGTPAISISVPSSGWSWINQGGATITTNASKDVGSLYLRAPLVGGDNLRCYVRSLPAGKTAIVAFRPYLQPVALNVPSVGILWRESSSGKLSVMNAVRNSGSPFDMGIGLPKFTLPNSFSASYNPPSSDAKWVYGGVLWMKMQDDGSNRIFSLSVDGENFHTHHSVGRTDFLTADQFGFFVNSAGMEAGLQLLRWEES